MGGELVKLKIRAYSDDRFTEAIGDGEFTTMLNPEKYVFKYKIELNNDQAPGTSAAAPRYKKTLPEDLELEFIFDRTGVIQGEPASVARSGNFSDEGEGIVADIEQFKKVVFDYNGEEHKPNYLVVNWGTLLFKGTLSEMDITYKLFRPDGTPLRAVAKAKFKGLVEDDLRIARENSTSPDLTHVRIVKQGDTLPLMTYRIYGDPKYYTEVARFNNLVNFRKLKPGQRLVFPPLKK